ncbi:MAG: hypothetical protein E7158_00070 [Firmicutes bacterium]|nr:hypothetical protein [Bacillota bacterium]
MEYIKQFYDEKNIDYIKRIYDNIIKKSVTSAVININEKKHELNLNEEFELKIKKVVFLSGMIALGVMSVNASRKLSNPIFRSNVEKSTQDEKNDVLTDKINQALSTTEPNNEKSSTKNNQESLAEQTVNHQTAPNTDIIGFAKLIVSSEDGMNGDLYNFYLNHSQDTFNKLIESIIFIDPTIDDNVVKDFDGYLKMKGFNSIEEWVEFSKNEVKKKNEGVGLSI